MFLSHWGFESSPFATAPGLVDAYPSDAFEEAFARIDYLAEEGRRVGALLGETGWGKSTVLHALPESLNRRGVGAALVDAVALSPQELLWQVASQLGASPDSADSTPRLWRRIDEMLTHQRWLGAGSVLLVDDADQAGPDVLRQLTRLAGLGSAPGARWTIILATTARRLDRLGESLLHRIDLRVELFPWRLNDTIGYVQHALIDAGRLTPIFTGSALSRLHELAAGVPRHVARLADFALVAGAGAELEAIGPDEIDAAFNELRWTPPVEANLVR